MNPPVGPPGAGAGAGWPGAGWPGAGAGVPLPVNHAVVWDHLHARAFNAADHPSLAEAPTPRPVTGAHGLTAVSPALVGVYPAARAEPYAMAYVPPAAAAPGVPDGFYVACVPDEEFVVRVGGRGGMDAVCEKAGSPDVLVNVSVGGREVGDSSVWQKSMGDIADDVFYGFKASEDVGSGEAMYSKFCFRKADIVSEEEAREEEEKRKGGDGKGEEDRKDSKTGGDVGLLEVRFATAVRIPAESSGNPPLAPVDRVRVGKGAGEVGGVTERLAAKSGISVGVAGSSSQQSTRRNFMDDAVCYGEDVKELSVTVRLRELWWLTAKGVMAGEDGKFVKHEAAKGIFLHPDPKADTFMGSEPPSKKAKTEKAGDGGGDDDDDDDDDEDVDVVDLDLDTGNGNAVKSERGVKVEKGDGGEAEGDGGSGGKEDNGGDDKTGDD